MFKNMKSLLIAFAAVLLLAGTSAAYFAKANFAYSYLGASLSGAAPTLSVLAGTGGRFPDAGTFRVVIYSSSCANASTCATREIASIAKSSADIFTIVGRSQESTTAPSSWPIGSRIEMTVTAGLFTELEAAIDSKVTGTISDVQSRVTGTCASGAMSSIAADGTVSCRVQNERWGWEFASFDAAVTSIGTTTTTLIYDTPTNLTSNTTTTVPATLSVEFRKGGSVTKTGTGGIHWEEPFTAGLYQVLIGFSPGDITGLFEANIMWFGAHSAFKTGYETFDNSTAINTALASFGNKGILYAPKGWFKYGSTLNKKPGTRFIGIGADFDHITAETEEWIGTTLFWTSPTGTSVEVLGGNTVTVDRIGVGSYWHGGFEHISFKADWSTMVDSIAISFLGSKKEWIRDCDIRYFGTGIKAEFYNGQYAGEIVIRDSYLGYMKFASIDWYKTVDSSIENSKFGGDYYGLYMDNCSSNKMINSRPQNGQVAGVYVNNSRNFMVIGGDIDTNGDATHTADGAFVKDSIDINFIGVTFYDNTGNGLVYQNSHECKVIGNSFGRHGQVGPINSSGIVFKSDSSGGGTGDTYRMTVSGNHFTVDSYFRDFTGRGTLERGILVTNGTLTTDFVRQLNISGNDFYVATALHLENGDVVPGNTSNLTTGMFKNNNVTNVTTVIKNPAQLTTNEFQYSRDEQIPATTGISTKGNESIVVDLYDGDSSVYQFASPLTTTQTVTLSTNNPIGNTVEILRTGGATGNYPLEVKNGDGTVMSRLIVNQWAKFLRILGGWVRLSEGPTSAFYNPGADIASAGTIVPTAGRIMAVTGTAAINNITVPFASFSGSIDLIPLASFTTTTAGNIAIPSTAVTGRTLTMTYSSSTQKWYPNY